MTGSGGRILNPKPYTRIPSPHLKRYCAGSLPAWSCFEKHTGPKAPSVNPSSQNTTSNSSSRCRLPSRLDCLEKQTETKAPSVSHPARTKHPIHFPRPAPLPPGLVLKSRRGRRPRLSAIPQEHSIQCLFLEPTPPPPGIVLKSKRGRRPRLSAIPPPPEHCIQFIFPGLDPFPPRIVLTSRRGRRPLLAPFP